MKHMFVYFLISKFLIFTMDDDRPKINAVDKIRNDGYSVESHAVVTSDGYTLGMHRVKCSTPRNATKSAIFIMHGMFGSSNSWVTTPHGDILPYALCDRGYDIWLGNARGSLYSRTHAKLTTMNMDFWNFSFHEISILDMPSMIDYILDHTGRKALHYIAYSQGGTTFLVMASMLKEYNQKIKSAHLFGPIAYMEHTQSPVAKALAPIFGEPGPLMEFFSKSKCVIVDKATFEFMSAVCQFYEFGFIQRFCEIFIQLLYGDKRFPKSAIPGLISSTLLDGSSKQGMHYLQLQSSGHFRQYDYGSERNQLFYGQATPPGYPIEDITAPMYMYFGNDDVYVQPEDLSKLVSRLNSTNVKFVNITNANWGHMDFLWSPLVRDIVHVRLFQYLSEFD